MAWTLRQSYTLLAPLYDGVVERAFRHARRDSLRALPTQSGLRILIDGIGTGLDLPLLPPGNDYVGTDLTHAMLRRAARRVGDSRVDLVEADSLRLPFAEETFDHAVLHLILAVVPDAATCLHEAARVIRPGGRVLVFDKFLRHGKAAPLRRMLNCVARHVATRTDVVFEEALARVPSLRVIADRPALAGGWFRHIVLEKAGHPAPP